MIPCSEQRNRLRKWPQRSDDLVNGGDYSRQCEVKSENKHSSTSSSEKYRKLSNSKDTPRTPPSYFSSSRPKHQRVDPLSPPNPLRLATTSETRHLPRSEVCMPNNRLLRPQIHFEYVGDPRLRIFKVALPRNMIDGPLQAIIEGAETHVLSLRNGWRTELYSLTKCDVACNDVPNITIFVKPILAFIKYAILTLYRCSKVMVDHNQPHILKYSARDGHTGVQLHHDRCDVTANLALSGSSTYTGGGTYFADMNQVVRLNRGEFILHPGCLVHGGSPITGGTRYLLVTFANLKH